MISSPVYRRPIECWDWLIAFHRGYVLGVSRQAVECDRESNLAHSRTAEGVLTNWMESLENKNYEESSSTIERRLDNDNEI